MTLLMSFIVNLLRDVASRSEDTEQREKMGLGKASQGAIFFAIVLGAHLLRHQTKISLREIENPLGVDVKLI